MKRYYFHIALWVFMTLFIFDYYWYEDTAWHEALAWSIIEILGYLFLFYLNVWNLKRHFPKQWIKSISISLLIMIAYVVLIRWSGLEGYFYESEEWRNVFSLLLNSGLFTALAYLFFQSEQSINTQERNLRLVADNKQLQIDSLKARINPHFLFNTLNNMNTLIVRQDEQLPRYLSKLSSVLRYSIDEGVQSQIALQKEWQYLEDYIALLQMQEPASEDIDVYMEGEIAGLRIIPFVLMTLVENAVKHGDLLYNPDGHLHISATIEEDFVCEISNSFSASNTNSLGTGLDNIRKQLDLVYTSGYELELVSNNGVYLTKLQIPTTELKRK